MTSLFKTVCVLLIASQIFACTCLATINGSPDSTSDCANDVSLGVLRSVDGQCVQYPDIAEGLLERFKLEQDVRNDFGEAQRRLGLAGTDMGAKQREYPILGRTLTEDARVMGDIDRANQEWIKDVLARIQWPSKSKVGKRAAHAAWSIVQHADNDIALQKRALELMTAERSDVDNEDFAYLTDRILNNLGEPQVYGMMPMRNASGELVAKPVIDPANVDKRRAEIGLMSLSEYIRRLNEPKKAK